MVGAMKFWEGDGSKSPRHHFGEGVIFKGMFDSQDPSPRSAPAKMKMPPTAAPAVSDDGNKIAPCLRTPGTPSKHQGCNVQFEAVEWRNHEILLDGSGGLPSSGTALGLGWKVESERWAPID